MASPRILPIIASLDDIAESIAEPPSRRPFARAVGEAGRRVCDRLSANPNGQSYGGFLVEALSAMCGPYWDEQGYDPPIAEPAFTGGQCPGSSYRIVGSYNAEVVFCSNGSTAPDPNTSIAARGNFQVTGPVVSMTLEFEGGSCRGERFGFGIRAIHNGGASSTYFRILFDPASVTSFRVAGFSPALQLLSGSDDCGDPPPEVKPGPNPAPDPGPIPTEDEPFVDPISGPVLPVPPLPTIPGLPGIPWRNPFGPDSRAPGDLGEPGETVDADGIGDGSGSESAEGEAEPGQELVGLRLSLRSVLPRFPEFGDGIYRAGAYIRMGGPDGLDQDLGGAQIEDGQFFYAEKEGLTKWRVDANVGISWLVTPYYREVN